MKTKRLLPLLLGLLLVLQAFPIDQNLPKDNPFESLNQTLDPPDDISNLLQNACYDCHSYQTQYPWYTRIQPIGWWIQHHVREGREGLNFSTFSQWNAVIQADILRHCAKMLKNEKMPLQSYLRMHPEAQLDARQQTRLLEWLNKQAEFLESGAVNLAAPHQQILPSDTCDDKNASLRCCFVQIPEDLNSVLVIAPSDEPGQRIKITGHFYERDGKTPYANVLIYAYQTDTSGRYTQRGDETGLLRWHGRLHAWARTDKTGRYEIQTIRPAAYPGRKNAAHIHMVVWEPGSGAEPYYIQDFLFADDPLLSAKEQQDARNNTGRSPVLTMKADGQGLSVGRRDIILK